MVSGYLPPFNVRTVQDVTGLRNFSTVYYNTKGRMMYVLITAECTAPALGDRATLEAYSPSTKSQGFSGYFAGVGKPIVQQLILIVAAGASYRVVDAIAGTGVVTLWSWVEVF